MHRMTLKRSFTSNSPFCVRVDNIISSLLILRTYIRMYQCTVLEQVTHHFFFINKKYYCYVSIFFCPIRTRYKIFNTVMEANDLRLCKIMLQSNYVDQHHMQEITWIGDELIRNFNDTTLFLVVVFQYQFVKILNEFKNEIL